MSRVANVSISRNVLLANQRNLQTTATLQQQLASGKRMQAISDDPVSARRALIFRTQQFESERYQENIEKSLTFMQATDTSFSLMAELADEAKQIAVRGATASEDANSRAVLAQSIDGLLSRMVDVSNTVHDGRYIFAGTAVLTKPFSIAEDGSRVNYAGDLSDFSVAMSRNNRVEVNLNGHALFKGEEDVFQALVELRDRLREDDAIGVSELIDRLDRSHRHITGKQGELGARMQRVELTRQQIEDAVVNLGALISAEEDVDLAETISKFQVAEVALESGLAAGARVVQRTLLDFL